MKKLFVYPLLCAALLASCSKDNNDPKPEEKVPATAKEYIQENRDALAEGKTINNKNGGEINLKSGSKVVIKPNTFTLNGEIIDGNVDVKVIEVRAGALSSSIFSGTSTNLRWGQYLQTYGYLNIDASYNGKRVDVDLAEDLNITISDKNVDGVEAQLWTALEEEMGEDAENPTGNDREGDGQFGWRGFWEDDVNDWDWNNEDVKWGTVRGNAGGFSFDFGKLGWVNVDVIWNPKNENMTLKVILGGMIGEWASYMGWNGNTYVFFIAEGYPVVVQIYTQVQGESNAVESYYNQMPAGVKGKLLAFSVVDGKYYMDMKEITTSAAEPDVNMQLRETTKAVLDQTIKGIDGYGDPE